MHKIRIKTTIIALLTLKILTKTCFLVYTFNKTKKRTTMKKNVTAKQKKQTQHDAQEIFKDYLVLFYTEWLQYSIKLKKHFNLFEGTLFDNFIPIKLEDVLDKKTKLERIQITNNENVDSFIIKQAEKVSKIPFFILLKTKESNGENIKKVELVEMDVIIPHGEQGIIESHMRNFFEKK